MGLTASQLRFLAYRLTVKTDKDAAEAAGIHPHTVTNWKLDEPEFVERYDAMWHDGVLLARDILRQQLGRAAEVLTQAMDAKERGRPDFATRLTAAVKVLQSHGLIAERREVSGPGGGAIPVQLTADDLREAAKRARQTPESDEQQ